MTLSERVKKLRQQSLDAEETLSSERAELMTEFYKQDLGLVSAPLRRALALQYLMERKAIYIGEGELIVGEKGPAPKATPTYPELCCHSLQDLDILNGREKIPFAVSPQARQVYQEAIIPFWQGKSMRDLLFTEMTGEWKAAYEAGIFTEFMEQRAPGHTVLDDKIYRKGMLDFKADIQRSLQTLDYLHDPQSYAKEQELQAMSVCAEALIRFAQRHADLARASAKREADPRRKAELERIAEVCTHVPAHAPRDFWEALQYYWFVHLGVTTELNTWDAFCPGHLDRHLYPFYQKGMQTSEVSKDFRILAEELLQCFWIKFNNQPAPPKVGVTAAESGTYTDFAQINLGGLMADGSDGVNEVTYLLLDVIEEMRLLQPSSSIQVSKKNPDRFVKRAARIIRTGFGQPSVFNADLIVQELVRMGKSVADARSGGSSGCVEVGAFGKEAYILSGYFNMPKVLELTLHNGLDPRTGRKIGLETGNPATFESFEEFFAAYEKQLRYFIDIKVRGNNVIERLYAAYMPAPFLSLLIDDCIATGKDYHDGGARYNSTYIQGVGLGTLTDAMTAIKYHVFDREMGDIRSNDFPGLAARAGSRSGDLATEVATTGHVRDPRDVCSNDFSRSGDLATEVATTGRVRHLLSMDELLAALNNDFEDNERLRQLLLNKTPKYGNDDDYADRVMVNLFNVYFDAIDGRPNTKGGAYRINLLPTTVHVYFGSVIGATPDGRRAWTPLSEGVSPVQGADRHGPTAVLRSVAKMDHVRTGGTLLNQKFTPQLLKDEQGLDKLVGLIRTYFKLDGHHIQFNVVDAATLRAAQQNPAQYRDLIVRVAGYSDYFCDLSQALQDEIIARTEHQGF